MESPMDEKKIKFEHQLHEVDMKPIVKQEIKEEVIVGDNDWKLVSFDNYCETKHAAVKSEHFMKQEHLTLPEDHLDDKGCILKLEDTVDSCDQETKPKIKQEPPDVDTPCLKHEECTDNHEVKPGITTCCTDNHEVKPGIALSCTDNNYEVKPGISTCEDRKTFLTSNGFPNIKGLKQDPVDSLNIFDVKVKLTRLKEENICFMNKNIKLEFPANLEEQTVEIEEEIQDFKPHSRRTLKVDKTIASSNNKERSPKQTDQDKRTKPRRSTRRLRSQTKPLTQELQETENIENSKVNELQETTANIENLKEDEIQETTTNIENTQDNEEPCEVADGDVESTDMAWDAEDNNETSDSDPWQGAEFSSEDDEPPRKKKKTKVKTTNKKEPAKKLPCDKCEAMFAYRNQLRAHQEIAHNLSYQYHCKKCLKGFRQRKQAEIHEETNCYTIRPFLCTNCNRRFTFKHDFTAHTLSACGNKELAPFMCDACGKKFLRNAQLQDHIKTKCQTLKLFKCKTCNKEYKIKQQLKLHEESKCGTVKSFVCEKCGKAFRTKQPLIVHVASNCVIYSI